MKDHMEMAFSRVGLMRVSFCFPHAVAVITVIICRGVYAFTETLCMCVYCM